MNPLENSNKWEKARFESAHALMALGKLNSRSDIQHSQAEAILVGLIRKIGFPKVADKYENLSEEKNWSY